VERVSHRATLGDRHLGVGARRPDSLPVLTPLIGWIALICRCQVCAASSASRFALDRMG
jgi:hypothetical protein